MDPRFPVGREELYALQMEVKQVQLVQSNQTERIIRLERRHEQDANLKSVWQQHPFPGVLAGTPQHGPTHVTANDLYDMDEPDHLLSSLHLGTAEEEPTRRGAASRANSVRFDESALRQSDWASQSNRHSGDFGLPRPSSGLMMERTLSHKSDGRHSSAGHSVHSVHSLASGRASSLGMHTDTFLVSSHEDDSPIDGPEPPPEFFVLGSVPTIIRCWITTHFAHHTIRYADLCTGSQRSTLDVALVREFGLLDEVERDVDGISRIRLPVYLVEATVAERSHGHRTPSPGHQIPSIMATFEITGAEQGEGGDAATKKGIQIFIGSDTLRAHMADVLLSQNRMSLLGNDREKLSVPFVRPEDDWVFKHICTANMVPGRPRLNANAAPFVLGTNPSEAELGISGLPEIGGPPDLEHADDTSAHANGASTAPGTSTGIPSEISEGAKAASTTKDADDKAVSSAASVTGSVEGSTSNRRESGGGGIWGSWRQGTDGGQRDSGPLSGYQPAGRGGRNMKILKPLKSGTSSARASGAAYETAPGSGPRTSGGGGGEQRRKSQAMGPPAGPNAAAATTGSDSGSSNSLRWEPKRAVSTGGMDARSTTSNASASSNAPNQPALPRSANPIGGASAFSWMNPAGKAKATATAE
ncbi:hypothetical protein F5X68DRAFT_141158 [Plectosphaerella plurivora]|uniref:Ubiquitin carboxyl-terminal hydrolase 19 n=1 Tax=Plectosphaerella plurivora TaxID=936078 RepID=A0A9P8V1L7_9PEZI|nr:hypothetical protein F5X68DRAFT_141158 [Plectosphaerella plurivora]